MIRKGKVAELVQDDRNANAGTVRGRQVVEESLRRYGAGRSVVVDRKGKLIAGNKTAEGALRAGIEDTLIVETTGQELLVLKRTDLDLDSEEDTRAREYAFTDNRSSELGLSWLPDFLPEAPPETVGWTPQEMDALRTRLQGSDPFDDLVEGSTFATPQEVFVISFEVRTAEERDRALRMLQERGYDARSKSRYENAPERVSAQT